MPMLFLCVIDAAHIYVNNLLASISTLMFEIHFDCLEGSSPTILLAAPRALFDAVLS